MIEFLIIGAALIALLAIYNLFLASLKKVRPYVKAVRHGHCILSGYSDKAQFMLVTSESGLVFKRQYGERYETEQAAEKARIAILERELELGENVVSLRDRIESKRGRL